MLTENQAKFHIRAAQESEAEYLSELANRSKSYWPYDQDYLIMCRAATWVTVADIKKWPFLVATNEAGDEIRGFAAICEVGGEKMMDHLWIEPAFIGKGFGRKLFEECVAQARKLGWKKFSIASDPYAEEFYLKMGAKRIGERESKVQAGYFLPLLEYMV